MFAVTGKAMCSRKGGAKDKGGLPQKKETRISTDALVGWGGGGEEWVDRTQTGKKTVREGKQKNCPRAPLSELWGQRVGGGGKKNYARWDRGGGTPRFTLHSWEGDQTPGESWA